MGDQHGGAEGLPRFHDSDGGVTHNTRRNGDFLQTPLL